MRGSVIGEDKTDSERRGILNFELGLLLRSLYMKKLTIQITVMSSGPANFFFFFFTSKKKT